MMVNLDEWNARLNKFILSFEFLHDDIVCAQMCSAKVHYIPMPDWVKIVYDVPKSIAPLPSVFSVKPIAIQIIKPNKVPYDILVFVKDGYLDHTIVDTADFSEFDWENTFEGTSIFENEYDIAKIKDVLTSEGVMLRKYHTRSYNDGFCDVVLYLDIDFKSLQIECLNCDIASLNVKSVPSAQQFYLSYCCNEHKRQYRIENKEKTISFSCAGIVQSMSF